MWKTDPGSDVERQYAPRRSLKPGPCVVLLTVSTLIQLLWWHSLLSHHPPAAFKASAPVESEEQAHRLLTAVEPLLSALHHKFDKACAFAAPNVHVYEQLLLLRLKGNLTVMMNPVLVFSEDAGMSQVSETSYMCDDATVTQQKKRYNQVKCSYFDKNWIPRKEVFHGPEAVCLQHFVEIFQGNWPCNTSTELKIPRTLSLKDL